MTLFRLSFFTKHYPLGKKGLVLQSLFVLTNFILVLVFKLNILSFVLGLVFVYLYSFLFFFSVKGILYSRKKALGIVLLIVKWLILFLTLIALSERFLDPTSFLLGSTAFFPLIACYVLDLIKQKIKP